MPLQEDYQITLESFRGPLDLLLYLIRRAEVDVYDIPIAKITDQYLEFLKHLDEIDIDVAGEFLLMAATLIEIKSRTIAPPQKATGDDSGSDAIGLEAVTGIEATDPRYELIQQLLAYQRFRIASDELEKRRIAFSQRHPRKPARVDIDATRQALHGDSLEAGGGSGGGSGGGDESSAELVEIELEDAHVMDLSEAYERIIATIDLGKLGDHKVQIDDTPIALHQEDLIDRLLRSGARRLTLQEAFEGAAVGQRVGLFLATLELVRLRRVTVIQGEIDSPIELVLNENAGEALIIESDEIAHYRESKSDSA